MAIWFLFGCALLWGASPDIVRGAWIVGRVSLRLAALAAVGARRASRPIHRVVERAAAILPLWPVAKFAFGLAIVFLAPLLIGALIGESIAPANPLGAARSLAAAFAHH